MSFNIRILVAMVALHLACGRVQSAEPTPAPRLEQRIEEIKTRLQLTPEQIEKIRPIVRAEVEKLRGIRDKYGADTSFRARRAKLREARSIQEDLRDKLELILSKEQMKEWKKMRKELREKYRAEMEERRSGK